MDHATLLYGGMLIAGGLAGSGHCLGMCGGFVLAVGAGSRSTADRLARQLVYAAGRIWVYALLGAAAGFIAWRLGVEVRWLVNLQAYLCLAAGALLVYEASVSLGWLRRPSIAFGACSLHSLGALFRSASLGGVFVAGVWNGLLPCGLLYAYLAVAASSGGALQGAGIMLLFGAGTVPALLLLGMSGAVVPLRWRQRLVHAAAWCLLATGAWTMHRGILYLQSDPVEPACPLCAAE
jgi:sulfite exporter TauE/SafE